MGIYLTAWLSLLCVNPSNDSLPFKTFKHIG